MSPPAHTIRCHACGAPIAFHTLSATVECKTCHTWQAVDPNLVDLQAGHLAGHHSLEQVRQTAVRLRALLLQGRAYAHGFYGRMMFVAVAIGALPLTFGTPWEWSFFSPYGIYGILMFAGLVSWMLTVVRAMKRGPVITPVQCPSCGATNVAAAGAPARRCSFCRTSLMPGADCIAKLLSSKELETQLEITGALREAAWCRRLHQGWTLQERGRLIAVLMMFFGGAAAVGRFFIPLLAPVAVLLIVGALIVAVLNIRSDKRFAAQWREQYAGAPVFTGDAVSDWLDQVWLGNYPFMPLRRDVAVACSAGGHPAMCHVRPGRRIVLAIAAGRRIDLRPLQPLRDAGFELRWTGGGLLLIGERRRHRHLFATPIGLARAVPLLRCISQTLLAANTPVLPTYATAPLAAQLERARVEFTTPQRWT